MKKYRRPDLNLVISRPAIIVSTYKQPFPGWIDSNAAAAAVIFSYGMGISSTDYFYDHIISPFIPCDFVVNAIFVSTAIQGTLKQPEIRLFHICPSGSRKDWMMKQFFADAFEYLKTNPWENTVSPITQMQVYNRRRVYRLMAKKEMLVHMAKANLHGLPLIGDKKKKMQELKRLNYAMRNFAINEKTFSYFRYHNQIHDTTKLFQLWQHVDASERELFDFDSRKVDPVLLGRLNMYGVGRFYRGIDLVSPADDLQ